MAKLRCLKVREVSVWLLQIPGANAIADLLYANMQKLLF